MNSWRERRAPSRDGLLCLSIAAEAMTDWLPVGDLARVLPLVVVFVIAVMVMVPLVFSSASAAMAAMAAALAALWMHACR